MSGPSVVALADEPSDNSDGGSTTVGTDANSPPAADTSPASQPREAPKLPLLRWLSTVAQPHPRVGPVAPPKMNLPTTWLVPATTANDTNLSEAFSLPSPTATPGTTGTDPQLVVVRVSEPEEGTKPPPASTATAPDETQSASGSPTQTQAQTPAQQPQQTAQTAKPLPKIGLLQLVPPGVPNDSGVRINNLLPDLEALGIDPNQPVLNQLLPTPLMMLITAAEQIPLVKLAVTPLMYAADTLIHALLSDVVISTSATGIVGTPAAVPMTSSFTTNQASLSLPAGAPPAEITPTGMDMPLAPAPEPTPPAPPAPASLPQPSNNTVGALSENVEYRAGYSEYLRNAGMAQITAIAVPGAVAILLFSIGGGFIGYRQARAGHVIRAEGIGRFLR